MNELDGVELDSAVALVLGVEPGLPYSSDWGIGGPLIHRFAVHLNGPEASVHRCGGPNSGWGAAGYWVATSWRIFKRDGGRSIGIHETDPLKAAMRMIAKCTIQNEVSK
ncbi:MAG: DUF2591 family protein [Chromatiales bacterium]|nr:DUF2591 family protein [Chromatiales bacterium]